MLRIFERRILNMVFGAVNYNGKRRTRCHSELYTIHNEPDVVKLAKIGILKWVGHSLKSKDRILVERSL